MKVKVNLITVVVIEQWMRSGSGDRLDGGSGDRLNSGNGISLDNRDELEILIMKNKKLLSENARLREEIEVLRIYEINSSAIQPFFRRANSSTLPPLLFS